MDATPPTTVDSTRALTEGPLAFGVLKFGAPLVLGMILHTAFNLVDMFMISRLPNSGPGLAALGLCDMVTAVATIMSNGISTATVAVIARRVGQRDAAGAQQTTWQSLLIVAAFSVTFGLVGIFGNDLLIRGLMQAKGETANIAARYLQVLMGGSFSIFVLLQLTAILRAYGHAKASAFLLILGNVINVFLNVVFIYGEGPAPDGLAWGATLAHAFHVPRMGVEGAAWATLVGRTVPCVVGALMIMLRRDGPKFHFGLWLPKWREILALLQIGWPSSAQFVLRVGSILVFLSLISANYTTATDPSALVAYSICLRLETMALFVGMGWGAAAASYVGVNLGAGLLSRAKSAGYAAALYNVAFMMVLGVTYIVFADPILAFFNDTVAVREIGRAYLMRVAPAYTALGFGVVLSQAMSGAGATRESLVLDAIVIVGITLPAAYVVTEVLALPANALFLAISTTNAVAALVFFAAYSRGRFLKKTL